MQKIQNFIENNKAAVAIVAVAAAIGIVGIKVLNSDNRGSAKILDASIQKVPLIERLGGEQAIQPMISLLFDRISNNKDLKSLFQNVEKSKVSQHFNAIVLYLFGGKPPAQQNFSDHCKLNITELQFSVIVNLLDQTLKMLGVDDREIFDAREAFQSKKQLIVSPNQSA
ncbi:unnamed protein product (macronuclear) [Paramecium tetraurelia]|uniref:Uncharacterized protein n=1 Tax=Paramecium tetraurelia TaxID=5888 RepID=A0CGW5_PARTE|nr:uncharacterized protein GSPATT00007472001 [Paramecium tetraurelia]CAK70032.1 unnamed protein product [Paramecium tetraurelia]|eukprot:XP_001437429.1 hypothetical protein (macronuclear) [Paramecium tetraurelia strain d4-2]